MEIIAVEDVASIAVFDVRLSESEMQYIALIMHYALTNLDDKTLHDVLSGDDLIDDDGQNYEGLESTPEDTTDFFRRIFLGITDAIMENCIVCSEPYQMVSRLEYNE